jgi:hypothetical protein
MTTTSLFSKGAALTSATSKVKRSYGGDVTQERPRIAQTGNLRGIRDWTGSSASDSTVAETVAGTTLDGF